MNKIKTLGIWAAIALCSLAFGAADAAKLAGIEQLHLSFALMGLPVWFGYLIGISEVAGAVGLFIRRLSSAAAMGLLAIMGGAIYFHLVYENVAAAIPAIVLSALLVIIGLARRQELLSWLPGKKEAPVTN